MLVAVAVACLLPHPALALVSLNDGADHIYVTGTFGVSQDSNIFYQKQATSDFVYNAGLSAEYTRRAGWIGVNVTAAIASTHFDKNSGEDFQNPQLSAEFTKQTGRTTGSLSLSAQRQNRADSDVNLRTASWNYVSALNFHYPVIERYSFSGTLGYSWINYEDHTLYADLKTYTLGANLFYILDNAHDLFAGYRYRRGDSPGNNGSNPGRFTNIDHAFNLGVSGRVLPRVNGAISVGYQIRQPRGRGERDYHELTSTGSLTYSINKKSSLTGQLSKDFSTTATGTSIDSTTANLNLQYAINARLTASSDVGWGRHRFLGRGGIIPKTTLHREDTSFNWDALLNYRFSQHLNVSAGYYFFENWSNLSDADFVRHSWNLSLTSRW